MIRVKICCIASLAEARLVAASGADAIGLVSRMPSGPGVIDEATIAAIAAARPAGVESVLLTAATEPEAIAEQHARCHTDVIQLVDRLSAGTLAAVRERLPGVVLMPVLHVRDEATVLEAEGAVREGADRLLLDSGNLDLAVKELGGTGRVHDWALSREIVARAGVPVFLAGGLRPDNVAAAVRQVRPWGLDVCTGVRREGALDPGSVEAFIARARDAAGGAD